MQSNDANDLIPSQVSLELCDKRDASAASENLLKSSAEHLYYLSKKVVENDISPQTVDSACKCYSELYKLLRLNWDITKEMRNDN